MHKFRDRREAGRALANALMHLANREEVIVLGLPRGGVPVACEVALALAAPLDVFVVRKLGVPGYRELAMGAIATGGVLVVGDVARDMGIPDETIQEVMRLETAELHRREASYRGSGPPADVAGRTVILVDDGIATGSTMRAAIQALRALGAACVVVAVPLAPADTCKELRAEADELICVRMPEPFVAVGMWYDDFSPTSDEEVRTLLDQAAGRAPGRRVNPSVSPAPKSIPS